MAKPKRRTFTPEFKAEVVLEALTGESSQRKCVVDTISAMTNSPSGSGSFLKMRRRSLDLRISSLMPIPNPLANLTKD